MLQKDNGGQETKMEIWLGKEGNSVGELSVGEGEQ